MVREFQNDFDGSEEKRDSQNDLDDLSGNGFLLRSVAFMKIGGCDPPVGRAVKNE